MTDIAVRAAERVTDYLIADYRSGVVCWEMLRAGVRAVWGIDHEQDAAYGCLSRRGIEVRWRKQWLVFLDIDGMHGANARWGYAETDRRIREALGVCRAGEAHAGRWYSGDEIVVLVPTVDAARCVIERLRAAFAAVEMSATYAIAAPQATLADTVAAAADEVQRQKREVTR